MKIVNLDQSGPDWHRWRSQGLGGSDAPVIMGDCTWTDLPTLRAVKAGTHEVPESYPMARGKRLEPLARTAYIERTGIRVRPVCVVHDQYPWLRASLDGLSEDGRIVLEIKCPLAVRGHKEVLDRGQVPVKYKAQVQHQLLVTGLPFLHFVSFTDSSLFSDQDKFVLVLVPADLAYQTELFRRERAEWELTNPDWRGLH